MASVNGAWDRFCISYRMLRMSLFGPVANPILAKADNLRIHDVESSPLGTAAAVVVAVVPTRHCMTTMVSVISDSAVTECPKSFMVRNWDNPNMTVLANIPAVGKHHPENACTACAMTSM